MMESAVLDVDDPDFSEVTNGFEDASAIEGTSKVNGFGPPLNLPPVVPVLPKNDSGLVPKVHNVVCSVSVECKLDPLDIALRLRNTEYNPKRFPAVIMRISDPKTTALIFRTGKIVVTGARSEQLAHLAARKFTRLMQKLDYPAKFKEFKIQNMTATCDVKFPIQMDDLYNNHCQFARYEPELFPGIVYRMVKPRLVILIFVSGKLVLTGAKSREDLKESLENIYHVLLSFKKK